MVYYSFMVDFSSLLNPKYWFDLTPAPMSGLTEKILLVFFSVIFLCGLFLRLAEKRKRLDRFAARAVRSTSRLGVTMGCLGLLLLFFSYEQVRLFGSRFWFFLWVLGALFWLVWIGRDYYKVAPREKVAEDIRKQRERYLPRRK